MTRSAYDIGRRKWCEGSHGMERTMLIIDDNSVYEIDEDCIEKKGAPPECKTAEKLRRLREEEKEQHRQGRRR